MALFARAPVAPLEYSRTLWMRLWVGAVMLFLYAPLIVLIIYLAVISRGDLARFRFGLAFGGVVSILLLVIIALQRELIEYPRPSPTLVLDATHSIRDFIPWSRAKEASATSFPGDHATVMMILALTWGLALLSGAACTYLLAGSTRRGEGGDG